MLAKEELLKQLRRVLVREEQSIDIYLEHMNNAVFWIGFQDDKISQMKDLMDGLANHSREHSKIIKQLIQRLEGEGRDAY